MSYQLQLASVPTPAADLDVFGFMNQLRQDAGTQPPSALLKRFHDALLAQFPDQPWSDGHYAGEAGRLTLVRRSKEVVPHVLYLAAELGLTVVDNKTGEVHRPPTYQVVLEGPAHGLEVIDAAARLAALLRKPVAETVALLSGGRRIVVKQGVSRFQAMQYAAALRDRGGCRATLAAEPGPAPRAKPLPSPSPSPAPAPAAAAPALALARGDASPAPSPYQAPAAALDTEGEAPEDDAGLFQVAEGLRMNVSSIGLSVLQGALIWDHGSLPGTISSAALSIMSIYGTWRMMNGLGTSKLARNAVLLLSLVTGLLGGVFSLSQKPLAFVLFAVLGLASLVVWVVLVVKAVRRLKQAGLSLGLFGAAKHDVRRLGGLDVEARLPSTFLALVCFSVTLLCFAGSLTQTKSRPQAAAAPVPCQFVGWWEYQKDGGTYSVFMDDDGTYAGFKPTTPEGEAADFVGSWSVADNAIQWDELYPLPGRSQAGKLTASGDSSFSVLEADGRSTLYELSHREPSRRCGFSAAP
ncbi:hypothetical protein [Pseudoduganella sp.]|uniref:hypothetical protein n=1 Tax=Pseudoduganella sp. TaxID=1880898 RepID=UPI0035AEFEF5